MTQFLRIALILLMVVLAVTFTGCSYKQIPPTTVGIKFNGKTGISQKLIKPQVVWVGLNEKLVLYPTSVKAVTYTRKQGEGERSGDDSIPCSTLEGEILHVDVTVTYHVEPDNVVKVFENFGTEDLRTLHESYLRQATNYAANVVSGRQSIFDLTSKDRRQFGPAVKAVLMPIVTEWGLTLDEVEIGEVYPPEEVTDKIRERLAVQTDLETAKNDLAKARIDAVTTITEAKRDAEMNRLAAEQGETAFALRRLQQKKALSNKWKAAGGHMPLVGDGKFPSLDNF